jgi:hypothetical protein
MAPKSRPVAHSLRPLQAQDKGNIKGRLLCNHRPHHRTVLNDLSSQLETRQSKRSLTFLDAILSKRYHSSLWRSMVQSSWERGDNPASRLLFTARLTYEQFPSGVETLISKPCAPSTAGAATATREVGTRRVGTTDGEFEGLLEGMVSVSSG